MGEVEKVLYNAGKFEDSEMQERVLYDAGKLGDSEMQDWHSCCSCDWAILFEEAIGEVESL